MTGNSFFAIRIKKKRSTFDVDPCTIVSMTSEFTTPNPQTMHTTVQLFLDCEFTGFVEPQLLSMGIVLNDSCDFYGELNVSAFHREKNEFVDEHVLSQWGKVPTAYSSRKQMAQELSRWLFSLQAEHIEVHYDYHTDMDLLESLLKEADLWVSWERVLVPTHVGYLYGDDRVDPYMATCWANEEERTGLKAHHALVDARVLRQVFLMVHNGCEEKN